MAIDEAKPINAIVEKLNTHLKILDKQIKKSMKDLKDRVNWLNPNAIIKDIMNKSAVCTTEQISSALFSMFSKKIKHMEYMFCASKN